MQERPHDDDPNQPQPAGPSKRNRNAGRNTLIVAAVAVAVAVAIGVTNKSNRDAAAGSSATDTTLSQPTDAASQAAVPADTSPSPVTNQGDPLAVGAPSLSPSPVAAPVAQSVTYACTGSAPDGVDITYGPSGSNLGASSVPFSKTTAYDSGAQYYVTTAQLSGSGQVTCTTTVQTDNGDGTANVVVNSGTASGGYNIASAQVCSSFTGGWEKC